MEGSMRTPIFIFTALGLISAGMPGARADICFQYGTGGGVAVAKGAKLPAPNTCIPAMLIEDGTGGRGGVATGTICTGDPGSSQPTLVFQYTYDACAGPGGYFESATCRISISSSSTGGVIDLPTQKPPPGSQPSSCNGVYVSLPPNQAGPLKQFTDATLNVWSCSNFPSVPGGGGAQCRGQALKPFSHPEIGETMPRDEPDTKGRPQ
jgi:hypothetical protein